MYSDQAEVSLLPHKERTRSVYEEFGARPFKLY